MTGTLVLGLGNVICSDDGLGVHAVARLRGTRLPAGVELVEGGTAGLLLLPLIADADHVVVIDAVDAGAAPGTLIRLADTELDGYVRGSTCHDVGLADLLYAAQLTGHRPARLVLHGAQPAHTRLGTALSEPVAAALTPLTYRVLVELLSVARPVNGR